MPGRWNPFAPCGVPGCPHPRAKRRAWCTEHAAVIDAAKKRCAGSARSATGIEGCGLVLGHDGPCHTAAWALRRAMLSVDYLGENADLRDQHEKEW